MPDYSAAAVDAALRRFGYYRVRRTQTVALLGPPDGISGATLMALGLRETGLKNVNGGAKWDAELERWVATTDDHGVFQISTRYHRATLARMPAVVVGSWSPVVDGRTAADEGYCPRFEDSLQYTLRAMLDAQEAGADEGIELGDLPRFSIVAHNAGIGGALRGYREGDPDRYTAGGDYSEWVQRHRTLVNRWLKENPKWRVE